MKNRSDVNYKGLAFLPMVIFLLLYVGVGVVFTLMGVEKPFGQMPRYTAVMIALIIALVFYDRGETVSAKLDVYCRGAGEPGVMLLGVIVLLAGGFASSATAMGGRAAVVNLGISLIPRDFLIPGIFMLCCFISTCIGTSMGTQVAMIPLAIAIARGAGLNPGMAGAAAIAGAYFGDNLSMISDTTIVATKGVGAEMKDKFRMNFAIALPAALITIGLYWYFSRGAVVADVAIEKAEYNLLQVLPYVTVLITAIIGVDVLLVLVLGAVMALGIGLYLGTCTFWTWAQAFGAGMEDMFFLAVFSMLISGLIGLIRYYGGIDWLVNTMTAKIKSSKTCQYFLSIIVMIISGTTLNNTVALVITAPIAKELGSKYSIAPKRLASLLDIFAACALMLVPHDSGVLLVQQYAEVSYADIVRWQFYPVIFLLFTVATIQFGMMKTTEEKAANN